MTAPVWGQNVTDGPNSISHPWYDNYAEEANLVHLDGDRVLALWNRYTPSYSKSQFFARVVRGGNAAAPPTLGPERLFWQENGWTTNFSRMTAAYAGNGYVVVALNLSSSTSPYPTREHIHLLKVHPDDTITGPAYQWREAAAGNNQEETIVAGDGVVVMYSGEYRKTDSVMTRSELSIITVANDSLVFGTPTPFIGNVLASQIWTDGNVGVVATDVHSGQGSQEANAAVPFTISGTTVNAGSPQAITGNWAGNDFHQLTGTPKVTTGPGEFVTSTNNTDSYADYRIARVTTNGVSVQVVEETGLPYYEHSWATYSSGANVPVTVDPSGKVIALTVANSANFAGPFIRYDVFGVEEVSAEWQPPADFGGSTERYKETGIVATDNGYMVMIVAEGANDPYQRVVTWTWMPWIGGNIGQLYVNLSTDVNNPNWVSVCPGAGGTSGTSEYVPSSQPNASVPPGWLEVQETPTVAGSVSDGSNSTFTQLEAYAGGNVYRSMVLTARFPPLPSGLVPSAMHMTMTARNGEPFTPGALEIHTLYVKTGENSRYDNWSVSLNSGHQVQPLLDGNVTTFTKYRFYYLSNSQGSPHPTTPDDQWQTVASGVGGVPGNAYDALTVTGLDFMIWPSARRVEDPRTKYLDIAEVRLVVAATGGPSGGLGYWNISTDPNTPDWRQIHYHGAGWVPTMVNLSSDPATPDWWQCCSHAP